MNMPNSHDKSPQQFEAPLSPADYQQPDWVGVEAALNGTSVAEAHQEISDVDAIIAEAEDIVAGAAAKRIANRLADIHGQTYMRGTYGRKG